METEDGYTFVKEYSDGYYYYAELGVDGDYIPSRYRVGIDDPERSGIQLHLRRSPEKIEEMQQRGWDYNASLNPQPVLGPANLGVILIEFPDQAGFEGHATDNQEAISNAIFSIGTYNSETDPHAHPDWDEVFGSMNDYWLEVSYGQFWLEGRVLNVLDMNDDYGWLMADYDREDYEQLPQHDETLMNEAIDKARAEAQTNPDFGNPDDYEYICVLFAGEMESTGLLPFATAGTKRYQMSENHTWGTVPYHFAHIGWHCHEFAHTLGLSEKYNPYGDAGRWGLMGDGLYNGPDEPGGWGHAASPAHPNAVSKIQLGWIPDHVVTSNMSVDMQPIEWTPQAYLFPITEGEYFVIENRQMEGFDDFLLGDVEMDLGLLIWHHKDTGYNDDLEEADNIDVDGLGNVFPGTTNNTGFTALTVPNSVGYNNNASGVAIKNIELQPSPTEPIRVLADLIINEWVGEIRKPREWSGEINVIGDVTVIVKEVPDDERTGRSLKITPGTTVRFSAGTDAVNVGTYPGLCEFIVEGQLEADGGTEGITFMSNSGSPTPGDWAGLFFSQDAQHNPFSNCVIRDSDIGVSIDGPTVPPQGWIPPRIINNTIVDIQTSGINATNLSSGDVINNSFVGCGTAITWSTGNPIIQYNNFHNNTNNGNVGDDATNVHADPLFVASGDYHLSSNSPLIDAGDIDLDGDGITWQTDEDDQDPDITRMDIGAYYYDAVPATPSGFTITGSLGESPTLHWGLNTEPDIGGYKIYRRGDWEPQFYVIYTATPTESQYTDTNVSIGKPLLGDKIFYYITSEDFIGQESSPTITKSVWHDGDMWKTLSNSEPIPDRFHLRGNYPNPFNPTTTIRYDLPEASYVSLMIYDILGREVRTLLDSRVVAGFKSVVWNGRDDTGNSVSTGIYIYALKAWSLESEQTYQKTEKMVLLR